MCRWRALSRSVVPMLSAVVLAPFWTRWGSHVALVTQQKPIYKATSYGAVCNGIPLGESGSHDDTAAIQRAIKAAEATGGTVLLPAGTCELSSRLTIHSGPGITLKGAVSSTGKLLTTVTDSVNPPYQGGDLYITSDHNTVEGVILNQHLYGGTAQVQASYTTFKNTTLLGGPSYFAVYFRQLLDGSHAEHNRLLDSTVVSLIDHTILANTGTEPCDDGLVWAEQTDSLIRNLSFTGTRLALYEDNNVNVDGYTYHPGPQTCGLDGYYVTQPSTNVQLQNLTMYGSEGVIGNESATNGISRHISVTHEQVEAPAAGTGYSLNGASHGLIISNVNGVTISDSNLESADDSNSYIEFRPTTEAENVVVSNTLIPRVSFWGAAPPGSTTRGEVEHAAFDDDTFPQISYNKFLDETFVDGSGGATTFSVAGGTWLNDDPGDKKYHGFAFGNNMTYTVKDLAGYDTPAYVQGAAETKLGTTLSAAFPDNVMAGDLLIGAVRSPHVSSVTDNLNGAWTEAASNRLLSIWYKTDAQPGATTVTVTGSSGPTRADVAEYFGLSLPDQVAGRACNRGRSPAVSTGSTAAVAAGDLVFAGVGNGDTTGSETVTAGSIGGIPATLRSQTTGPAGTIAVEDVISGAAGAQDATMTVASDGWHACVAAFGS
jgi:Pectate lyase superfamily protein